VVNFMVNEDAVSHWCQASTRLHLLSKILDDYQKGGQSAPTLTTGPILPASELLKRAFQLVLLGLLTMK
jgi:hypothetical protein